MAFRCWVSKNPSRRVMAIGGLPAVDEAGEGAEQKEGGSEVWLGSV